MGKNGEGYVTSRSWDAKVKSKATAREGKPKKKRRISRAMILIYGESYRQSLVALGIRNESKLEKMVSRYVAGSVNSLFSSNKRK